MDRNNNRWTVYRHTSPSDWVYIGITGQVDVRKRWANGKGYRSNKHFTNAIEKYGWSNFTHEILIDGLTLDQAKILERYFIAEARKLGKCYNITDGGDSHKGRPVTEETKLKISQSLKKLHMTPWNKGKTNVYSDETRQKMSENGKGKKAWNTGKQLTETTKQRISMSCKGKRAWNKGLKTGPQTEEHRRHISEANTGKKKSDQKYKRSNYTEEHRRHISEALKGKRKNVKMGPRPDQVKQKISSSRIGMKWVCKPWEPPRQIAPQFFDDYINDGWKFGKLIVIDGAIYKWDKSSHQWINTKK